MTEREEAARIALRARQGPGARYDDASAPAGDLDHARRGTAYFARLLAMVSDQDLHGDSRSPGVSRRKVIASLGLQARLLAETVAWVRMNPGQPMPFDTSPKPEAVDLAATLPSQALRNLFSHSEVHLNVEWRDLGAAGWSAIACDRNGMEIPIRSTPRLRAFSLWYGAYELRTSGRLSDIPAELQIPGVAATSLPDRRAGPIDQVTISVAWHRIMSEGQFQPTDPVGRPN